jgi:hypothetical protein
MLRFFRRIRQRLLTDNKFSKYLIYAIGEILLVVIGILIAFQVDSWNDERKQRSEEQILLRQLVDDYTANLEQLDSKIATRKMLISSFKDVLSFFDNPGSANKDSVMYKVGSLGQTLTFDPIENDLVASGRINIIKNQKLRNLLTKWSTDVIQVQEVEVMYLNAYQNVYAPAMIRIGIGRGMEKALSERISVSLLNDQEYTAFDFGKSRLEPSLDSILNNVELEGIVSKSLLFNEVINSESFTLRKQIIEILDLLEELIISKE